MPARTPAATEAANPYEIASVGRALDVLELVADHPDLTRGQLAARSGLTKVTLFRILANLERRGYVRREPGVGGYRLGMKVMHLAGRLDQSFDIRATARPVLEQLRRDADETVNLAVPVDGQVAYIDILESSHGLRMAASIGRTDEPHATALGKAMLAWMPAQAVHELVMTRGLSRKTERTIADEAALLQELRAVRERGYAVDDEENELGARCVAAPILGPGGAVIASVSVSGPTTRMPMDRLDALGTAVQGASLRISQLLGHATHEGALRRAAR
jgi:DNA-binding IclR family transcriptional regulator